MYVKYGSHQHANGEVTLSTFSKEATYDKRGQHSTTVVRVQFEGVLIASTQATIRTAILALETAYATNGQDWGLYHDDDTASAHFLDSSLSLGGVKVTNISYPDGAGAEYATGRTFSISLEAEFLESSGLLAWQETLSVNGDGGARFAITETAGGVPVKELVNLRTRVTATQTGSAIHLLAYPLAPAVIFPFAYRGDLSSVVRVGPTRDGNRFTNYETKWNYKFEHTGPLTGTPHQK